MKQKKNRLVSIIGRPNVGKSSLFNRMLGRRIAIVSDESGVTRDRNYHDCEWDGENFTLVDTGGMVPSTNIAMEKLILQQARIALNESSVILQIIDSTVGATNIDILISKILRRAKNKKVILVANKADSSKYDSFEGYELGLGAPNFVSALHGRGIGDLLDVVTNSLKQTENENVSNNELINVAVIGRPNAGKSSLINYFCNDNRVLVDNVPGTTRDAVDVLVTYEGIDFNFIDTAGMRKKARVKDRVETYSNMRAEASIERCDVAIVMVDALRGLEAQDSKIMRIAYKKGKGLIIVFNKWDLVEKDYKTFDNLIKETDYDLADLSNIPKISISALYGKRVNKLFNLIASVYENMGKKVNSTEFHEYIHSLVKMHAPPAKAKKHIHIYSVSQESVYPPLFVGRSNIPEGITDSYTRFIKNRILDKYGFEGCPIVIKWKTKSKKGEKKD